MIRRLAFALAAFVTLVAAKSADPGPLTAEAAFAFAKTKLPAADEAQGRSVRLRGSVDGKFVKLDGKVSTVGPSLALLISVEEKRADMGMVRWAPHLFVVKAKGAELELVAHLESPDLAHDIDAAIDLGSALSLSSLPVVKDGQALVATLRKAEGKGGEETIDETMVLYVLHKEGLGIAFSIKTETKTTEKEEGVLKGTRELNKVEVGKKGGKLLDLVVTNRRFTITGDEVGEFKPATERWCWSDKAGTYKPECK